MSKTSIALWGLAFMQVATFSTTIYLHRGLAHRGMRFAAPLALTFRVLLWMLTGIVPRRWVAVHRKHHRFTDVAGDPHSPMLFGYWKVQFLNVFMYRREARREATVAEYAVDLAPDRLDRALFDRSVLGPTVFILVLAIPWGLRASGLVYLVTALSYIVASAAINAVGHTFGSRPFPNPATNNWWLAILTAGEGLHNNHHARPGSARFSAAPGQPDVAWPLIRALERVRLVRAVKDARAGDKLNAAA